MPRVRQSEKSRKEKKSRSPVPDRAVELLRELRALPVGTLAAARALLFAKREEGVDCPCCGQFARVYDRKMSSAMAEAIIIIERATRDDRSRPFHMGRLLDARAQSRTAKGGGDPMRLRFHGLVDLVPGMRPDESWRVGYYIITDLGVRFALNQARAPKSVRVYAQECLGVSQETISVVEALGNKFNYKELMLGI
jgi:hypothetical protein